MLTAKWEQYFISQQLISLRLEQPGNIHLRVHVSMSSLKREEEQHRQSTLSLRQIKRKKNSFAVKTGTPKCTRLNLEHKRGVKEGGKMRERERERERSKSDSTSLSPHSNHIRKEFESSGLNFFPSFTALYAISRRFRCCLRISHTKNKAYPIAIS